MKRVNNVGTARLFNHIGDHDFAAVGPHNAAAGYRLAVTHKTLSDLGLRQCYFLQ